LDDFYDIFYYSHDIRYRKSWLFNNLNFFFCPTMNWITPVGFLKPIAVKEESHVNTPMAAIENQKIFTVLNTFPIISRRRLFNPDDTIFQGYVPSMAIISVLVENTKELFGVLVGL
jgi:hypothetical protein